MSMIDYDARPVTPQVLLVGERSSSVGYSLRDFLSRNGVPYEWVDMDDEERVGTLLSAEERGVDRLPVCVLPTACGWLRPRWKVWRQGWGWSPPRCCRSTT